MCRVDVAVDEGAQLVTAAACAGATGAAGGDELDLGDGVGVDEALDPRPEAREDARRIEYQRAAEA